MTTRFLTNLRLTEDHVSSATEEAGGYIPQPTPDSGNAGGLQPRASGTVATWSYTGITTGAGAGDGTTSVCSLLDWFGDDFFISANLAIESGACDGEDQDITDFAQATGTLTHAAFSAQIAGGVDFTLTIALTSRSWLLELIASGSVGVGTFKWAHDGTTYLGRDDPDQADWLGQREVHNNVHADNRICTVQAANGDLLQFYKDAASGYPTMRRSTNGGLSWLDAASVASIAYYPQCVIGPLANNNVIALRLSDGANGRWLTSWDHGVTWGDGGGVAYNIYSMAQAASGIVLCMIVGVPSGDLQCAHSYDGGYSTGSSTTVTTAVQNINDPSVCMAADGYPICVYSTDNAGVGNFEIMSKKATEVDGTAWDSEVTVMAYAPDNNDLTKPCVVRDINGDLYCCAVEDVGGANKRIVYAKSTDDGATWGAKTQLKAVGAVDLDCPALILAGGHRMVATYVDDTNDDMDCVSRGLWEAYSANACPCAIGGLLQRLTCAMYLDWPGSNGVAGDSWAWAINYYYAKERIADDSPRRQWRTATDGQDVRLVLDWGANGVSLTDGAVFFGCNVQKIKCQGNATDAWGGPSQENEIDFTIDNGSATTVYANGTILASTGLAGTFKDHELRGKYLRMTSGTDDGKTWKIADNIDGASSHLFFLDTTDATNINTNDTFDIFGPCAAMSFTSAAVRFEGILIESQQTAEGDYRVGVGRTANVLALAGHYNLRHEKNLVMAVEHVGPTPDSVEKEGPRWVHQLTFPWQVGATNEITAFLAAHAGRAFCFIPETSDASPWTDIYWVEQQGDIRQVAVDEVDGPRYDATVTLVEVK